MEKESSIVFPVLDRMARLMCWPTLPDGHFSLLSLQLTVVKRLVSGQSIKSMWSRVDRPPEIRGDSAASPFPPSPVSPVPSLRPCSRPPCLPPSLHLCSTGGDTLQSIHLKLPMQHHHMVEGWHCAKKLNSWFSSSNFQRSNLFVTQTTTYIPFGALVAAQLAEWSLPKPEVRGSNPDISKILLWTKILVTVEKTKIMKKGRERPI